MLRQVAFIVVSRCDEITLVLELLGRHDDCLKGGSYNGREQGTSTIDD
jgi:hypothetical protein